MAETGAGPEGGSISTFARPTAATGATPPFVAVSSGSVTTSGVTTVSPAPRATPPFVTAAPPGAPIPTVATPSTPSKPCHKLDLDESEDVSGLLMHQDSQALITETTHAGKIFTGTIGNVFLYEFRNSLVPTSVRVVSRNPATEQSKAAELSHKGTKAVTDALVAKHTKGATSRTPSRSLAPALIFRYAVPKPIVSLAEFAGAKHSSVKDFVRRYRDVRHGGDTLPSDDVDELLEGPDSDGDSDGDDAPEAARVPSERKGESERTRIRKAVCTGECKKSIWVSHAGQVKTDVTAKIQFDDSFIIPFCNAILSDYESTSTTAVSIWLPDLQKWSIFIPLALFDSKAALKANISDLTARVQAYFQTDAAYAYATRQRELLSAYVDEKNSELKISEAVKMGGAPPKRQLSQSRSLAILGAGLGGSTASLQRQPTRAELILGGGSSKYAELLAEGPKRFVLEPIHRGESAGHQLTRQSLRITYRVPPPEPVRVEATVTRRAVVDSGYIGVGPPGHVPLPRRLADRLLTTPESKTVVPATETFVDSGASERAAPVAGGSASTSSGRVIKPTRVTVITASGETTSDEGWEASPPGGGKLVFIPPPGSSATSTSSSSSSAATAAARGSLVRQGTVSGLVYLPTERDSPAATAATRKPPLRRTQIVETVDLEEVYDTDEDTDEHTDED